MIPSSYFIFGVKYLHLISYYEIRQYCRDFEKILQIVNIILTTGWNIRLKILVGNFA